MTRPARLVAAVVAALSAALISCSSSTEPPVAAAPDSTRPGASTTTVAPVPTVPPPATVPTCPPTPARAAPAPDRARYRLSVDVRLAENVVRGTTDVRFVPDLDTDRLVFRLWANGPRPNQGGGGIETSDVTVNGRAAPASAAGDPTVLEVPGRFPAGTPVEAHVGWALRLPTASRDRISRDGDAVRLGSFFPILPWEPGRGWQTEPATAAFAEASTAPVADFDLTVTVPDGMGVLASGTNDGPGHWTAVAMRDVALSVGRFTTATGTAMAPQAVQVTVGVHEGIAEPPERYLTKVLAVLADFGRRFGPYPWPTYTLAITPGVGGGIEYPAHVMQGPGTLGATTSHELAHMWFYGLVGNNQGRDPWLDEGLASWGEARYEATVDRFLTMPVAPAAAGHMGEPMIYWATRSSAYVGGVYTQGVQALAALGAPDLVDCALRAYVAVFAYRIARPPDLLSALRAGFPDAAAVMARFGVTG